MSDSPVKQNYQLKVAPKGEATIDGWQAFSVTAVKSDGHVIRWRLYQRSADPGHDPPGASRWPFHKAA